MRSYVGKGFKRRFLGLIVPPLVFALLDGVLTVAGQSAYYWSNHLAVNESSPFFGMLLQHHPLALLAGAALWLAMIFTLIAVLPTTLALILSIAITFAHTMGSGSWLFNHFELGYQLANAYYLLSACALGLGIRYALPSPLADADDVLNVPREVRWKIGAGVFGLAALLFLVPWQG